MDAYWQKEIETLPRDQLTQLQLQRLAQTLQHAAASAFYRTLFKKAGLTPEALTTLEALAALPFTTREDLGTQPAFAFVAVPKEQLVRMHTSSGTTGEAAVIFHTAGDVQEWSELVARSLFMTGMRPRDVLQNAMPYGLLTGGFGFQQGAERLGALVIPVGSEGSRRQIRLMQVFGTTAIHLTPSFALHLAGTFGQMDIDPRKETQLRMAFIGAEPHSEATRNRIESLLGIKAFDSYGLSEMNGPGVAFECPCQQGLHIWEDHFVVEIIDPHTLAPVKAGDEGELVLTSLMRRGMPLLRYRTKDLTRIISEPCECGRTHKRIARIQGRTDDMRIIKGVNIFPMQIEKRLMAIPSVGDNFQILLERHGFDDELIVKVEVQKHFFTGNLQELEHLRRAIVRDLKAELAITPRVKLVEPGSLPRSRGKAVRVIDNRQD
ncbi:MAG: phenylacetate--CoA ligase [Desulfobacterales bacterium]|nr:phenylacetate--CoA ligase [Desulfobacterales bacterium]